MANENQASPNAQTFEHGFRVNATVSRVRQWIASELHQGIPTSTFSLVNVFEASATGNARYLARRGPNYDTPDVLVSVVATAMRDPGRTMVDFLISARDMELPLSPIEHEMMDGSWTARMMASLEAPGFELG